MRASCVVLLAVLLLAPMPGAGSSPSPGACAPQDVPDLGSACRRPDGLWEVFAPDGTSLGTTHGPDPVPSHDLVPGFGAARDPACTDDPTGGYYSHIIYARAFDDADRYATVAPEMRSMVRSANGLVHDTAMMDGVHADLVVLCSAGVMVVEEAVLDTDRSSANFGTIVDDLRTLGYRSGQRKYWVFYDDPSACSCGGQGHVSNDDRLVVSNANNGNGGAMFAVNYGYTGSFGMLVMLHELGHNLGAVQLGAPHTTGAFHCTDGLDIMCYNDGGPRAGEYDEASCRAREWDCLRDDYFSASPTPGGWLATHWNLASPFMRFLRFTEDGNGPPTVDLLACAPDPVGQLYETTCRMRASDDSAGVAFVVEWDPAYPAVRVPQAGHVVPGTEVAASHAWESTGTKGVRVYAVDSARYPRASLGAGASITVVDVAPDVTSFSCTPAPTAPGVPTTCTFESFDPGLVTYRLEWGDGAVATVGPVAARAPARGVHAYDAAGAYESRLVATDPAGHASVPVTAAVAVEPPCGLDRSGLVLAGLGGFSDVEGVTWRAEAVPPECAGKAFVLRAATSGADFRVCWHAGDVALGCHEGLGDEIGNVPLGADRAVVSVPNLRFTPAEYRLSA